MRQSESYKEWFIAETIFGDKVVLQSLPDEYTYDFKTADETYIMKGRIAKWMQFPESEYIPFDATPSASSDLPDSTGQGDTDPFRPGTPVEKQGGEYLFPGTVVASFLKLAGQRRYVVEDDRRSLHIFSAANLRERDTVSQGDAQTQEGWRREKLDKVIKTTVHAHAREQLSRDECADLVRGLLADFDDMTAGRHEFAACYAPPAPADRSEGGR